MPDHHPTASGACMSCTCGRRDATPTQYAARALVALHVANPDAVVLVTVVNGEHRLFCGVEHGFTLACDNAETAQRMAARHTTDYHQE